MTYSEHLNTILHLARQEAQRLGNTKVEPEHLMLGILRLGDGLAYSLLLRSGVDASRFKEALDDRMRADVPAPVPENTDGPVFSRTTERILRLTSIEAGYYNADTLGSEHLLLSVLRERLNFPAMWLEAEYSVTYESVEKLHPKPHEQVNDVAGALAAGEKLLGIIFRTEIPKPQEQKTEVEEPQDSVLLEFGTDLTQLAAEHRLDKLVGRTSEIERIVHILMRRKKNNPVLVGEAGVGKTAIVEGLAQGIVNGTLPMLKGKRIININMANLVAGTSYRGQFEERMEDLVDELREHPEIILFIDEIHTIIGAGNLKGGLDASNILKPALARGEIRCIGATTVEEYRTSIEHDAALERRFQKVDILPADKYQTYAIIMASAREIYTKHHHVVYTNEAIEACLDLSERYLSGRCFPDKALDVLDEAGARKSELWYTQQKVDKVTEDDIALVVSEMSGIPVQRMTIREKKQLADLGILLKRKVIGQDAAVDKVAHAVFRSRLGIDDPKRPAGVFFFLGPTGVGKTWLARCLAQQIFGTEDALIRFDMSEYMEPYAVSTLVGAPPGYVGYDEGGKLTKAVHQRPYSVLLFDEIEKAHHDIFNLMLQLMDDGRLTDRQGRTVDFRNTFIIFTSNAGTRQLRDFGSGIGFGDSTMTRQQTEQTLLKALNRTFPPEFVNRLDEVVFFHPLDRKVVRKILDNELKTLTDRLLQKGYKLVVTPKAKRDILAQAFDPLNGARPVKRALRRLVEEPAAEQMLRHTNRKTITIDNIIK